MTAAGIPDFAGHAVVQEPSQDSGDGFAPGRNQHHRVDLHLFAAHLLKCRILLGFEELADEFGPV